MSDEGLRQLKAIMFTDIKGYSAMMGANEERTVRLLQDHREVVREILPRHRGIEQKTIGDAFLVLFDSAVNAVRCAVEIQTRLRDLNMGKPEDERVWIRIGIHLGDIIVDERDVYGDGVNIAARVEPQAEPGGICITQQVFHQVEGKIDQRAICIGRKELKNIKNAPELYHVMLGQIGEMEGAASLAKEAPRPKARRVIRWSYVMVLVVIAVAAFAYFAVVRSSDPTAVGTVKPGETRYSNILVLPFENLSRNQDVAWMGTGISQGIYDRLRGLEKFKVVESPAPEIVEKAKRESSGDGLYVDLGRKSGVKWVISGNYTVFGDELRVTGKLLLVDTKKVARVVQKGGNKNKIIPLQEELIKDLLADLSDEIHNQESLLKAQSATTSEKAFEAYSKARALYEREHGWNKSNYQLGVDLYLDAVSNDPKFVNAHFGLSNLYHHMWQEKRDKQLHDKSLASAEAVVALDPKHSRALYHMCRIYHERGENQKALERCEAAIKIAPDDSDQLVVAWVFEAAGRLDEAEAVLRRMVRAKPQVSWIRMNIVDFYVRNQRLDEAEVHAREAARLQDLDVTTEGGGPTVKAGWFETLGAHSGLGRLLFRKGVFAEAKGEFEKEINQASGRSHVYKSREMNSSRVYLLAIALTTRDKEGRRVAEEHLDKLAVNAEAASDKKMRVDIANQVAWVLATEGRPDIERLKVALQYSQSAVAESGRKNGAALDTLAEVYERMGDRKRAAEVNEEGLILEPEAENFLKRKARLEKSGVGK
jgi:class 3 adenylate cyclase/tetratricopeptide (TPR) repeat protein